MTLTRGDKEMFWNNKICNWEKSRYVLHPCKPLLMRRMLALDFLNPILKDRTVLELGCGSAMLAEAIVESGARKYIGIDFSKTAIDGAMHLNNRVDRSKFELIRDDVVNMHSLPQADIIFSLGLLDWLTLDEISDLKRKSNNSPYFMHSFSSSEKWIGVNLHKLFTLFTYGFFNGFYVPKYFTTKTISTTFKHDKLNICRHKGLGIGCIVKNW